MPFKTLQIKVSEVNVHNLNITVTLKIQDGNQPAITTSVNYLIEKQGGRIVNIISQGCSKLQGLLNLQKTAKGRLKFTMTAWFDLIYPNAGLYITQTGSIIVHGLKSVAANQIATIAKSSQHGELKSLRNLEPIELCLESSENIVCRGVNYCQALAAKAHNLIIDGTLIVANFQIDLGNLIIKTAHGLRITDKLTGKITELNNFGLLEFGANAESVLEIGLLNNHGRILGKLTKDCQKRIVLIIDHYNNVGEILINKLKLLVTGKVIAATTSEPVTGSAFINRGLLTGEHLVEIHLAAAVIGAINYDLIWSMGTMQLFCHSQLDNFGLLGARTKIIHTGINVINHALMVSKRFCCTTQEVQVASQARLINRGLFLIREKLKFLGNHDFLNYGLCFINGKITGTMDGVLANKAIFWGRSAKFQCRQVIHKAANEPLPAWLNLTKSLPETIKTILTEFIAAAPDKPFLALQHREGLTKLPVRITKVPRTAFHQLGVATQLISGHLHRLALDISRQAVVGTNEAMLEVCYSEPGAYFVMQQGARISCLCGYEDDPNSHWQSNGEIELKQTGDLVTAALHIAGRITAEQVRVEALMGAVNVADTAIIFGNKEVAITARQFEHAGLIFTNQAIAFAILQLLSALQTEQITVATAINKVQYLLSKIGKIFDRELVNCVQEILKNKGFLPKARLITGINLLLKIVIGFELQITELSPLIARLQQFLAKYSPGKIIIAADHVLQQGIILTTGEIIETINSEAMTWEQQQRVTTDWIDGQAVTIGETIRHLRAQSKFCQTIDSYLGATQEIIAIAQTMSQAGLIMTQGSFNAKIAELFEQLAGSSRGQIKAVTTLKLVADSLRLAGNSESLAKVKLIARRLLLSGIIIGEKTQATISEIGRITETGIIYTTATLTINAKRLIQDGILWQKDGLRYGLSYLIAQIEQLKQGYPESLALLHKLIIAAYKVNCPEVAALKLASIEEILNCPYSIKQKFITLAKYLTEQLPVATTSLAQHLTLRIAKLQERGISITTGSYQLQGLDAQEPSRAVMAEQIVLAGAQIAQQIAIAGEDIIFAAENQQGAMQAVNYCGSQLSSKGQVISLGTLQADIAETITLMAEQKIIAAKAITLLAKQLQQQGLVYSNTTILLKVKELLAQVATGEIVAEQGITLLDAAVLQNAGRFLTKVLIARNVGEFANQETGLLRASEQLIIAADKKLSNAGQLDTAGVAELSAHELNITGRLIAKILEVNAHLGTVVFAEGSCIEIEQQLKVVAQEFCQDGVIALQGGLRAFVERLEQLIAQQAINPSLANIFLYEVIRQVFATTYREVAQFSVTDREAINNIYHAHDLTPAVKIDKIIAKLKELLTVTSAEETVVEFNVTRFNGKGVTLTKDDCSLHGQGSSSEIATKAESLELQGILAANAVKTNAVTTTIMPTGRIYAETSDFQGDKVVLAGDLLVCGPWRVNITQLLHQDEHSYITAKTSELLATAMTIAGDIATTTASLQAREVLTIAATGKIAGTTIVTKAHQGTNQGTIEAQQLTLDFVTAFENAKLLAAETVKITIANGSYTQTEQGLIWGKALIQVLATSLNLAGVIATPGGIRTILTKLQEAIAAELINESLAVVIGHRVLVDAIKVKVPELMALIADPSKIPELLAVLNGEAPAKEKWQRLTAVILAELPTVTATTTVRLTGDTTVAARILVQGEMLTQGEQIELTATGTIAATTSSLQAQKIIARPDSCTVAADTVSVETTELDLAGVHIAPTHKVRTTGQTKIADHALVAKQKIELMADIAPILGVIDSNGEINIIVRDPSNKQHLTIIKPLTAGIAIKISAPLMTVAAAARAKQQVTMQTTATYEQYPITVKANIETETGNVVFNSIGLQHLDGTIRAGMDVDYSQVTNLALITPDAVTIAQRDIKMPVITDKIKFDYALLQAYNNLHLRYQRVADLTCPQPTGPMLPGSLIIELLDDANSVIFIAQDIKTGKDIIFLAPSHPVIFGKDGGRLTSWIAGGRLQFRVQSFDMPYGRLFGKQGLAINSLITIVLGRLTNEESSGIMSEQEIAFSVPENQTITSNKAHIHVGREATDSTPRSNGVLRMQGKLFDHISGRIVVFGDAYMDIEQKHRLLYEDIPQQQRVYLWDDLIYAEHVGGRVIAKSSPATMQVLGTLHYTRPITVIGSTVYYRAKNPAPGVKEVIKGLSSGNRWEITYHIRVKRHKHRGGSDWVPQHYGMIHRGSVINRSHGGFFGRLLDRGYWYYNALLTRNLLAPEITYNADYAIRETLVLVNSDLINQGPSIISAPTFVGVNMRAIINGLAGNTCLILPADKQRSAALINYLFPSCLQVLNPAGSSLYSMLGESPASHIPRQEIVSIGHGGVVMANPHNLQYMLSPELMSSVVKLGQIGLTGIGFNSELDLRNPTGSIRHEIHLRHSNTVIAVRHGVQRLTSENIEALKPKLFQAIQQSNMQEIRLILQQERRINAALTADKSQWSPLHEAVVTDKAAIVALLLQYGAVLDCEDHLGATPLHYAVVRGNVVIARQLIQAGANLNARTHIALLGEQGQAIAENFTVLQLAVLSNQAKCVALLLEYAETIVDAIEGLYGLTALHIACFLGQAPIVKHLLEHGANIEQQDLQAKTPKDYIIFAISNTPEVIRVRQILFGFQQLFKQRELAVGESLLLNQYQTSAMSATAALIHKVASQEKEQIIWNIAQGLTHANTLQTLELLAKEHVAALLEPQEVGRISLADLPEVATPVAETSMFANITIAATEQVAMVADLAGLQATTQLLAREIESKLATQSQQLAGAIGLQVADSVRALTSIEQFTAVADRSMLVYVEVPLIREDGSTSIILSPYMIEPKDLVPACINPAAGMIFARDIYLHGEKLHNTGVIWAEQILYTVVRQVIFEQLTYRWTKYVTNLHTKGNWFGKKTSATITAINMAEQQYTAWLHGGEIVMQGEQFSQLGGVKSASKDITATFNRITECPVSTTVSQDYFGHARSRMGMSRVKVSGEVPRHDIIAPSTQTPGDLTMYANGEITMQASKTIANRVIIVSKGQCSYEACVILNQLPPQATRVGGQAVLTTGTQETARPCMVMAADGVQVASSRAIMGNAVEIASPWANFIGERVEFTMQPLTRQVSMQSQGIDGCAIVSSHTEATTQTALPPIFMVSKLVITATNGDVVLISPIIIGDKETGEFIMQAINGDATIMAGKLHNEEESTTLSCGFSMTGLSALKALRQGDLAKAARAIAQEIPLLATLAELAHAGSDNLSIISSGIKLASCAISMHKAGAFASLANFKSHLLQSLGFDDMGQWSAANLRYQIRFGKETSTQNWSDVVAGSIHTAQVLLTASNRVNVFAADIACRTLTAKGKKIAFEARARELESTSHSVGVSVGVQGGTPFVGVDWSQTKLNATTYVPTRIHAAESIQLIAEEDIQLRQAYLTTAMAFIEASSLLIETLQNKLEQRSKQGGLYASCNMAAAAAMTVAANTTVGGSKKQQAWADLPAGIEASERLHLNVEQVRNVGGVLHSAKQAKALEVSFNGHTELLYQHFTPTDNDCAFHALGVSRAVAAHKLLLAQDDPKVRSLVAPEINEAIILGARGVNNLPRSLQPEKVAKLQQDLLAAEDELQRSTNRIKGNHGVTTAIPMEQVYEALKARLNASESAELLAGMRQLQAVRSAIFAFANEVQTYSEYIAFYVACPGTWLGFQPIRAGEEKQTGVIDAIAYVENLAVRIWQRVNSAIEVVYSCGEVTAATALGNSRDASLAEASTSAAAAIFGTRSVTVAGSRATESPRIVNMFYTNTPKSRVANHFDILHISAAAVITSQLTYESLVHYDEGYKFNVNLQDLLLLGREIASGLTPEIPAESSRAVAAAPSPSGKGKAPAESSRAETAAVAEASSPRAKGKAAESSRAGTAAPSPSGKGKAPAESSRAGTAAVAEASSPRPKGKAAESSRVVAAAPSPSGKGKAPAESSRTATTAVAEALSPRAKGKAAESSRAVAAAPSPSGKGAKQVAGTTRAATAKATTTATTRVAKGPESTRKTVQKPARVEATAALSPSGKGKTVAVAPSPREQSKPIAEGSRTATTAVAEALSPRAKGKAAESSRARAAAPSPSIRENRSWFIRLLDAINPIGTVEAEELPIQAGSPQAAVGVSRELTPSQRAELGATLRQAGYPESLRQAAELQDDAGDVTWQSRQDREFYARLDAMDLTLDRSRPGLFSPSRRSYLTGNPSDRRSYLTEAPSGRRYNSWLGNIGLLGTGLSAGVAANMVLKTVARAFPATTIAATAMQLESQTAHYAAINPDLISDDHDFIPSPGRWDRDFAASQARLHRVAQEQTEHPIRDFYAGIPERVVDAYHEQPFELGFGVGFVGDLVRPVVAGAARSVNAGMLRLFDLNRARQAAIADSAASVEIDSASMFDLRVIVTSEGTADSYQYYRLKERLKAQELFSGISQQPSFEGFPDRKLLKTKLGGHQIPDPEYAYTCHTQLGTRVGSKGKYRQAREFDAQNRLVRDIDFTDHGRPDLHPNPHQHEWLVNPGNGVTMKRSKIAKPLLDTPDFEPNKPKL